MRRELIFGQCNGRDVRAEVIEVLKNARNEFLRTPNSPRRGCYLKALLCEPP
jgi:hypothetical protein